MTSTTFITLGPEGTCHENALRAYLEFQELPDARVELVSDLLEGLERVRQSRLCFLLQCSAHPDVHLATERYRQQVFVLDTFLFPAKEMGLVVRRDVEEPMSLGVVPAAVGYADLGEWDRVVEESANPIVARGLLAKSYDAGITLVELAEQHSGELEVRERFGEVDTTWLVYGQRRRYSGSLIGHRLGARFFGGEEASGTSAATSG